MSVRAIVRLGAVLSLGSDYRLGHTAQKLGLSTGTTYFHESSSKMEVYVGGTKSTTFESDGGILHGSWNVEASMVTSDRRLKSNIVPLQRTLREVIAPRAQEKKAAGGTTALAGAGGGQGQGPGSTTRDGAIWLLRQLRPVSYSFRKGMDSKFMRFGFIADELDSVVPEVVRRAGDRDVVDQKAVVYQDLIALLASATQSQQKLIATQKARMQELEKLQADMLERITYLQKSREAKKKSWGRRFRELFRKRFLTVTTVFTDSGPRLSARPSVKFD